MHRELWEQACLRTLSAASAETRALPHVPPCPPIAPGCRPALSPTLPSLFGNGPAQDGADTAHRSQDGTSLAQGCSHLCWSRTAPALRGPRHVQSPHTWWGMSQELCHQFKTKQFSSCRDGCRRIQSADKRLNPQSKKTSR